MTFKYIDFNFCQQLYFYIKVSKKKRSSTCVIACHDVNMVVCDFYRHTSKSY